MKRLSIFALLAIAGLTLGAGPQGQRACVILRGLETWQQSPDGPRYTGMGVLCSSSSSNAPAFEGMIVGGTNDAMPLAEAVAQLLSQGYRIVQTDGHSFTLIK